MVDVTLTFRIGRWIRHKVLRYFLLRRARTWVFAEATIKGHRLENSIRDFPYAAFTYFYVVDRVEYSGKFRHYLPVFRNQKRAAERYFALFPSGTRIAIKFDPQHPERSVKE